MMYKRRSLVFLIIIAGAVKIFSLYPSSVEKYYSTGIYPFISAFQRIIFGWIPFSIGDLFYAVAVVWLVYQLIIFIRKIRNKKADKFYFRQVASRLISVALLVYIIFNVLWGLNYNRRGIAFQLKLETSEYTNDDLVKVAEQLVIKLNALQPFSEKTRNRLNNKKTLFSGAKHAYENLAKEKPFLKYTHPSVKPSVYSYVGNYLGFTGYYNPFSGEAQVNTAIPAFVQPFVACHEIGHQLGYAKESEANFAGYLSASSSKDPAFLYSVYFDMYAYTGRYLYMADSLALKRINKQLSPGVKNDILEIREFFSRYSSPLETAIDRIYSQYLKANEQPSGRMSYNEVVAMLIAYYRKSGKI